MDRRTYARLYARRQRDRKLDAERRTTRTCPRKQGRGRCGGMLMAVTDGAGRSEVCCPRCERRWRGICLDCPKPVQGRVGTALRCAEHKARAVRAALARYAERNRKVVNARARASYKDPAVRARRNEYKRLWRKLNPDKVKAQKRRAALRGWGKEYQAKRRERERTGLAARERARYHGVTEQRTCIAVGCSTVVRGRVKKCSLCKAGDEQRAAELLARHRGRGRRTDLERAA